LAAGVQYYPILAKIVMYNGEQMAKWMTLAEVATYLSTSRSTVYKLKARGRIRGYRVGRSLRFDRDELDMDIKEKISESSNCRRTVERGK
jgi:excisionase family DNA binding protein